MNAITGNDKDILLATQQTNADSKKNMSDSSFITLSE